MNVILKKVAVGVWFISNLQAQTVQAGIYTSTITTTQSETKEVHAAVSSSRTVNKDPIVFGKEIFKDKSLSFEPSLNLPTPINYHLSAGDEVIINVWGASEMKYTQTISSDGTIIIPNIGPVPLSGLCVEEAKVKIKHELSRIMAGIDKGNESNTFVNVSLGQIRSIKVNIVGEVVKPGTYTLSSLATLFNALYMAGGVNDIGTLRDIKVYRKSKEITSLDVYDYLLNGKFDSNIRLEDNDMVIVKPYDKLVNITGKVKRNRSFELKNKETLDDLIHYAGGFTGDAYINNVRVSRKAAERYKIFTVDKKEYSLFVMEDKDDVKVDAVIPMFKNRLRIRGAVWRGGEYELSDEINTIKNLIESAGGLKGDEFIGRAQLSRLNPDFTKEIIAIDIKGILNGTISDIFLKPEDELYIPSIFDLQENYTIQVRGAVNKPATFPFRDNMTIEDAVIAAGGLKEAASLINVEVARRLKDPYTKEITNKTAQIFNFTLSDSLKIIHGEKMFILHPFDEVIVRFSPGYQVQQQVRIKGEILFAGTYILTEKNERLSDLVRKAGGISQNGYIRGASLKRRINEDERRRMEAILNLNTIQSAKDSMNIALLNMNVYTVGIDLEKALEQPGSMYDIVLRDDDELFIPQFQSTVRISGAVNYANSVTYSKNMGVKEYLSQAGGYTDVSRKYPVVVYMNGKVATTKRIGLFFKKYPKVEAGAEIIVPMKTRRDQQPKTSLSEILSIGSSSTSMAAMITSLMNNINNK
ncbi:SLBB domain-containing protein [Parabacteroides pacaensis]|uniref:SLBB domain-containing protein n=1 Tax=Parabacteroides pacaensis TaxID=2086575 RepID=UPI000D0ED6D2|nr:SLBB domain-containing protein [Parabacteroides pacaensis]